MLNSAFGVGTRLSITAASVLAAWTIVSTTPAAYGADAQATHSIMAFNVLFRGANQDANLKAIEDTSPDVICFREIETSFAGAFLDRFKEQYPHRRFRRHKPRPAWGVAIASKHPISDWRVFPERPYTIPAADAVVNIDGKELRVVCVHLIPPVARYRRGEAFWQTMERNDVLRRRQAKYLLYRYRDEARPVVMLGDFNEDTDGPALSLLDEKGFTNSCVIETETCEKTWPAFVRVLPAAFRFDHILGRNLNFVSSEVVRAGGSDHYPVAARFTLP